MVSILETPIGEITLDSVLASAYIMTFRNMLSKMNDVFFHHSNLQTCLFVWRRYEIFFCLTFCKWYLSQQGRVLMSKCLNLKSQISKILGKVYII